MIRSVVALFAGLGVVLVMATTALRELDLRALLLDPAHAGLGSGLLAPELRHADPAPVPMGREHGALELRVDRPGPRIEEVELEPLLPFRESASAPPEPNRPLAASTRNVEDPSAELVRRMLALYPRRADRR
jgi:hypothetical protein